MHVTSVDIDPTKHIDINNSRYGSFMQPAIARALLAKSKAIRAHVLLIRRIEAERGPLTERVSDRRQFDTAQDLLDFADRRHNERRFSRAGL